MADAVLRIPPLAEQVRTVRLVAVAAARRVGLDEEAQDEVRLAVGEAAARAVRRHLDAGIEDDVVVTLGEADDLLVVDVVDRAGTGLDDEDEALSLALAEGLADRFEVSVGDRGGRVRLEWVRPA